MKSPSKLRKSLLICFLVISIFPLPLITIIWAVLLSHDSFPLTEACIGAVVGIGLFVWANSICVILWQHEKWQKMKVALFCFLLFDLGWLPVRWYQNYSTRPHPREELAFQEVRPPKSNISGIWKGSWTNPKSSLTESITLDLTQNKNLIEGFITTSKSSHFIITDGVISGEEINLFYDHSFRGAAGSEGTGTLLGKVTSQQISGKWYANNRTPRGSSRDGPWTVSKIKLPN